MMNQSFATSVEVDVWVLPSRNGDAAAVKQLIQTLFPYVIRQVNHTLGACRAPNVDAADIIQELWVELFANSERPLAGFDAEHGCTFRTFATLVARRRTLDYVRRTRSGLKITNETDGVSDIECEILPQAAVEWRQLLAKLLEELETHLSPMAFNMFERLYLLEQTPEEIKRDTGLSRAAIYQWRRRVKVAIELWRTPSLHRPLTAHL